MVRYILVTGGVISGIGKGIIASSTGLLLKALGFHVTAIKIDPYLNIDAGTMNPVEHGEVFVLDDGGEVDLDLGNYERFLDVTLNRDNNITTGKIYNKVILAERKGDYLGKTVQVIPHITDAIMDWVETVSKKAVDGTSEEPDICIIELGGTVGDIESAPFVEAMRQFQFRVGDDNFCLLHVSLVPVVGSVGEQKTKPTQASVRDLRGLGLSPDVVMCRCQTDLEPSVKAKISMFCHVKNEQVFSVPDIPSLYAVPLLLERQGLVKELERRLKLTRPLANPHAYLLPRWTKLNERQERMNAEVKIAIVGKYVELHDSYTSVTKSLEHAAMASNRKLKILWVDSTNLENEVKAAAPAKYQDALKALEDADGILVPGGFGKRGIEGMIVAANWARVHKKPYLGICLGLQIAVVEFARSELGMTDAHSTEMEPETKFPVVINMPEISTTHLGGTMRLGWRTTLFVKPDCLTQAGDGGRTGKLYGNVQTVQERHRHRYEVNPKYVAELEKKGMMFVGHDDTAERMEIMEIPDHPYYVATQFHPEFKTRPLRPSPVFVGLILASSGQMAAYLAGTLTVGVDA